MTEKDTGFVVLVELPRYVRLDKLQDIVVQMIETHGGTETVSLVVNEEPCKQGCADCGL